MILFVHHIFTRNIGDIVCGPYRYFEFGSYKVAHISEQPDTTVRASAIIFGGGVIGSATVSRWRAMRSGLRIGWGIGSSRHNRSEQGVPLGGLNLLGAREMRFMPTATVQRVPCVSCMSSLFDQRYPIRRGVGIFTNAASTIKQKSRVDVSGVGPQDRMENTEDFDRAVRFLGESETVVTNSYHGAYWAMLLGRRVLIMNPYSSKFHGYQRGIPILRTDFSIPQNAADIAEMAESFSGVLSEARTMNQNFYATVKGML